MQLRNLKQVKLQSKKLIRKEQHSHKLIFISILIIENLESIYTPPGEVTEQKELLIKMCEDIGVITKGTPGNKFNFSKDNYLVNMLNRIENTLFDSYGENPLAYSYILVSSFMLTLDQEKKNVMYKVFNEDCSYKYQLLKYLHECCDGINHDIAIEFDNKFTSLVNVFFKSMYK